MSDTLAFIIDEICRSSSSHWWSLRKSSHLDSNNRTPSSVLVLHHSQHALPMTFWSCEAILLRHDFPRIPIAHSFLLIQVSLLHKNRWRQGSALRIWATNFGTCIPCPRRGCGFESCHDVSQAMSADIDKSLNTRRHTINPKEKRCPTISWLWDNLPRTRQSALDQVYFMLVPSNAASLRFSSLYLVIRKLSLRLMDRKLAQ